MLSLGRHGSGGVVLGRRLVDTTGLHHVVKSSMDGLEPQWLRTIVCDNLHGAIGPGGQVALSCYRDVSQGKRLVRRYQLFVLAD